MKRTNTRQRLPAKSARPAEQGTRGRTRARSTGEVAPTAAQKQADKGQPQAAAKPKRGRVVPAAARGVASNKFGAIKPAASKVVATTTPQVPSCLTNAEVDQRLDGLARTPATWEKELAKYAAACDRAGRDLEIVDPQSWRRKLARADGSKVQSAETQFRHEVDQIVILEREDEFRLARRIEYARVRLANAVKAAGLKPVAVEGGAASAPSAFLGQGYDCVRHKTVCRRWAELHALRTELVERNLYLVLINVERYAHTSAGRLDLMQEGSAALYRAVDGFEWQRGLLFRTYAVHWLNQAFRSYLYNCTTTVRLPVYLQKAQRHVWAAQERLKDGDASVAALAKATGLAESVVETVLDSSRSTMSIDAPSAGTDDAGLRDRLAGDRGDPYRPELEDVSLSSGLQAALANLSEREQTVVRMRFGIGLEREYTLSEVAAKLGVSLERVRQIQLRAMGKLKTDDLERVADPYLN